MMRRPTVAPLVVGALVAALVATLVLPAPSSEAFWSARVSGGSSAAQATAVQQVGTPTATVANQRDISVAWPAATLGDGTAVTGYAVTRTSATGVAVAATGGCAGVVAATSCVETGVPDGRWTYSVVARFATSWAGPASTASATAIADTVAPANALSITVSTGRAVLQGDTVWYRGAGNGSLRVVNAVSDALSGPASSSSGTLAGTTTGWSHVPTNVSTPAGGPFASAPFTWDPGTTSAPTTDFVGFDAAGNQTATRLQLRDDSTPPSGGAITHPTSTVRATSSSSSGPTGSVRVMAASVADSGGSGVVSRLFERRTATLTGDTCGTFGSWTQVASTGATVQVLFDDAVAVGTCVQYRHVITDAVSNVATVLGGVVKVKPTYPSTLGTTGLVDHFRFDASNVLANATGGAGTTGSSATTPTTTTGVVVGDASTAAVFDGVDDFIRTPRTIGDSFSIELWFRSSQGLGSGTQWYTGAGLVDGEVANVANDFGITLSSDGRVMAGVGNPDSTISSCAGLNDNQWHHVVMTRDRPSGLVILYVDGVEVRRMTASTATLSGPANIDIGRLQTGMQHFRGSIDEVAIYSRVLTAAEVQAHHANAL